MEDKTKKRELAKELEKTSEQKIGSLEKTELKSAATGSQEAGNLEELRQQEAINVEIGQIELGSLGDREKKLTAEEIEGKKEEEKLKEEVRTFFRQIILNSDEPERQEIEAALRKIAVENEIKFDEIIDESYKLRDEIVKMIKNKKFDAGILSKISKWLELIFPESKEFCKQAALRLANDVREHWQI